MADPAPPRATFGQGFLRDLWYFAALSSAVKAGDMRRYEILGEPVLIGRDRSGRAFALRDVCPHRAAPLAAGRQTTESDGATSIECPYHGWRFRAADGVCAAIPSLVEGQDLDPSRIRVRAYPAAESQGMIFVWIAADPRGPSAPDAPPPEFPGAVGGRPKIADEMVFDTHMDHAVVGLMDPTHAPYVHQAWWARSAHRQHEKAKAFEPGELGFVMTRHAPSKANRLYDILGGQPQTEISFRLPGYRWEHVQVGKRQVLALTLLTPITESATRITQLIWSDHPVMALHRLIAPFAREFLAQDGRMVNLQNEGLRYDPSLIWIDDADRQAKWYQALKREWLASRVENRPFKNPVEPTVLKWRS
ncbi:MAG: 2Fe-2S ferredoxin [Caulobacteraceae bacterium]|nr:2Fe-2S ferredoxin [Caulobacteraceae bacterium]